MSKAKGRVKPMTTEEYQEHLYPPNGHSAYPVAQPELKSLESTTQWWGVQDDKGNWAFVSGEIVHYPCESIAAAHAGTLSPRWKAVAFGV